MDAIPDITILGVRPVRDTSPSLGYWPRTSKSPTGPRPSRTSPSTSTSRRMRSGFYQPTGREVELVVDVNCLNRCVPASQQHVEASPKESVEITRAISAEANLPFVWRYCSLLLKGSVSRSSSALETLKYVVHPRSQCACCMKLILPRALRTTEYSTEGFVVTYPGASSKSAAAMGHPPLFQLPRERLHPAGVHRPPRPLTEDEQVLQGVHG